MRGSPPIIVVLGASSGTGHMVLQVAERLGFTTRIAVCNGKNMSWVQQHCRPTHCIDYTNTNVFDRTKSILRDDLGSETIDVVLDCVTSEDSRDSNVQYPKTFLPITQHRYIRLGGRLGDWVLAGFERRGMNCFGKEKLFWIKFPYSSDHLRQLQEWADDDGANVKPRVQSVVDGMSVEGVQEAMDQILSRRVAGKIVVKVLTDENK